MKVLLTLVIGIILAVTAYLVNQTDTPQSIKTHKKEKVTTTESVVVSDMVPLERNGMTLSTGQDMFIADSPSEHIQTDEESQPIEKDSIVWAVSEKAEKVLKAGGKIPGDVSNEVYIELDIDELNSVVVGDFIDLYIPQIGGSYAGEVDHIEVHSNGDRTVEAYIPGAGTLYSAVITLGENAVYGTLGTQADVYIMEGDGKYAWIASKSDLVANHSTDHEDGVVADSNELPPLNNSGDFNVSFKKSPKQ